MGKGMSFMKERNSKKNPLKDVGWTTTFSLKEGFFEYEVGMDLGI